MKFSVLVIFSVFKTVLLKSISFIGVILNLTIQVSLVLKVYIVSFSKTKFSLNPTSKIKFERDVVYFSGILYSINCLSFSSVIFMVISGNSVQV